MSIQNPIPRCAENLALWKAACEAHPTADPSGDNESFIRALEHFRRAAEAAQLPGVARAELLCWITSRQPDDERSVLINVVSREEASVLEGYLSDGVWFNAYSAEIEGEVLAWAEMPRAFAAWKVKP